MTGGPEQTTIARQQHEYIISSLSKQTVRLDASLARPTPAGPFILLLRGITSFRLSARFNPCYYGLHLYHDINIFQLMLALEWVKKLLVHHLDRISSRVVHLRMCSGSKMKRELFANIEIAEIGRAHV